MAQDTRPVRPRSNRVAEVTKTLQKRGWVFLKVSGKSMFPWIREGDIVLLRGTRIQEVVRGDVVVFETNGTLCIHRVLAVRGSVTEAAHSLSLVTKGDATADADSPIYADDLRGKVEFVYRRDREIRIASGWRKYFGTFLAFVSPALAGFRLLWLRTSSASAQTETAP